MPHLFDAVTQLTSGQLPDAERSLRLAEFTRELGWRPSDRLDVQGLQELSSAQLLVEHGLEHSAVLTFLRSPIQFPSLSSDHQKRLLASSYNNLVDWHVAVEANAINFAYARTNADPLIERLTFTRDRYDNLRSDTFEEVVSKRPSANFPALDDALIRTVSMWKRGLAGEVPQASNIDLSRLFNAVIFTRAVEDQHRRTAPNSDRALLEEAARVDVHRTLRATLRRTIRRFVTSVPAFLFHDTDLAVFDTVGDDTIRALLASFYDNRYAPYQYDFAVISKHALSRIYEHYVSLLRLDESPQLHLLPQLASEYAPDRSKGAVYTPQFIARFFARFLREHTTPFQFKRLKVIDPACGSGIFLRTLLEFQCDPTDGSRPDLIAEAFQRTTGIDQDQNAVAATELSLSLLHLVLMGTLPQQLPIFARDFLAQSDKDGVDDVSAQQDVILANPPFVPIGIQHAELRARVSAIVGSYGRGRLDLYLAFLKRSIDLLKPGGFGLFVLPHSFLMGKSARGLRQLIAESCWVRCLADLSAIRVFGDTNVYVVLLIFQKRSAELSAPSATIIKCQDDVGHALQDAIEGKRVEGRYYSIYDASQRVFAEPEAWVILPPTEAAIRERMNTLPKLKEFVDVKQGIVTGADDIFIVDAKDAPKDEQGSLFIPLLADREMQGYSVPRRTAKRVFVPFWEGGKIDEKTIRKDFPVTWKYLSNHRKRLESRKSLAAYKKQWWEPMWPREPLSLQRPKLVTPHLIIMPRFALDERGRYAVSRSPFLVARAEADDLDILKMLLAVLNSRACFWHIQRSSHVYSHGYAMLENKTLEMTPVPDISGIGPADSRRLIELVDRRRDATVEEEIASCELAIERLACDVYGLTVKERRALGVEL